MTLRREHAQEFCWWETIDRRFLWQEWSHNYCVFNLETGETHVVNELPAAVLRRLNEEALSLRRLAADLAETCNVEMTTAWEQKLVGVLADLEHIELIERVPTEQI
jgi:PqqD family protein of HPr-rel-A system